MMVHVRFIDPLCGLNSCLVYSRIAVLFYADRRPLTLNDFVRAAQIFELPASLIR